MNNRELEKNLFKAIENSAPDNLGSIKESCRHTIQRSPLPKASRFSLLKPALSLVAALVLFVGGFSLYNSRMNAVFTTVDLDVNPSIELQINRNDKIINAIANNEDGKKILADMNFKGSDVKVAVNAIVGSMVRNGYLSELTNSILVSIQNKDEATAQKLQQQLAAEINNILQTETFSGAVLAQTVSENDDTARIAQEYAISLGKAQLIQEICDKTLYTPADLAPLNINDLSLILKHVNTSSVSATGTPSDKQYIGEDRALEIAMSDLGITDKSLLRDLDIEFEYEKGQPVYDIEFEYNGNEYEYDIDAVSARIVDKNIDTADRQEKDVPEHANVIGKDKAKEIVLNHAGVKAADVKNYEVELDSEKGSVVYEIEFDANGYEYEYEINAVTGKILKSEKEKADGSSVKPASDTGTNYIGKEKAKQAALKHAGVKENNVKALEVKLDKENGKAVYEVEFKASGYEYDYEIDALTGKIIKSEKEKDDDSSSDKGSSTVTTTISADQAKQIALKHAGVTASKVKAELDNGVWEIEFTANGYEYEYEINATTGKIIHSEKEAAD